jgi:hypothetical protein
VRGAANAIASNGMKEAGYIYVNVDDCWQAGRDEQGRIQPNKNFGDMKALADYVHSKGRNLESTPHRGRKRAPALPAAISTKNRMHRRMRSGASII